MSREFSTYLNLLRICAALAVFLGHAAWLWTPGHFEAFHTYGWVDPVLAFFVMSGFVIAFVVERKEHTPGTYAINRAARIYSVALPALVATFALDALGRHLRPGLYDPAWGYSAVHQGRQFGRALVFLNEIWGWRSMPGSNGPFWSLAYEVWYYVAFGLAAYLPRRWGVVGAGLALLAAGPMVIALFPVWLLGVACYRIGSRVALGQAAGWALCLGGALLLLGFETWATRAGLRGPPVPLFAHRWELLQDYVVGLCVAGHLLGMQVVAPSMRAVFRRIARPVGWAAGATFTLYLFHFPVAQLLAAADPWPPGSVPSVILVIGGTLAIVPCIAVVTEHRKEAWRHGLLLLAAWVRRLRPAAAG